MEKAIQIRVYDQQALAYESPELDGPVEIGRQKPGEEGPYALSLTDSGRQRLIVARLDEATVSRRHILVEPLAAGRVRLTNLRDMNVRVPGSTELRPGTAFEFSLPCDFPLAKRTIRIVAAESDDQALYSLAEPTRLPGRLEGGLSTGIPLLNLEPGAALDPEAVSSWLYAVVGVLQSAVHSIDFYQKGAQAALGIIGLDTCRVLLRKQDDWQTQSEAVAAGIHDESEWRPSRRVLTRLQAEKKTFWRVPGQPGGDLSVAASLVGIRAVVAAPILDPQGQVIGALYGERRQGRGGVPQITKIDAMMMDLLASGIATGLARTEMEKAALAERVRFEQFFTPELSRQLAGKPELLEGQETDVSMLMCDIRGSSRITERLGPAGTIDWIRDVLSRLSDCVLDQGGVLVDYTGDGLGAMWGAPDKQPDHAAQACHAALAMLQALPALNERWQARTQEPLALGIGINTGLAQVGNIGSHRKFKYGAMGNTVNLASRVEGASKYFKVSVILTGSARARLDSRFWLRRLSRVRLLYIAEPVDLYQLVPAGTADWIPLRDAYERALLAFENKDLRGAARVLGALQIDYPHDGASLTLLERTVHYLADETAEFDPVWTLPGK
jgi:adenylate cyclase